MTSLSSRLIRMEQSGLIHQVRAWPESEYQFRHTLVQDAAYGTLLMDERQSIHLATAEETISAAVYTGEWQVALKTVEHTLNEARRRRLDFFELHLLHDRGRCLAGLGNPEEAEAQLLAALGKTLDAGVPSSRREIEALLEEIYDAKGVRRSSERYRSEVAGTVRTLASSLPDPEQRRLFMSKPDVSSFLAGRSE